MDNNNYYEKRNIESRDKFKAIIAELPKFCLEFFIGIESRTSILTRLNYAYDLRIFFNFIVNESGIFNNTKMRDLTLQNLEEINASDIEYFISYLSSYNYNNTEHQNTLVTKARKLATVKSMFKYYYNKDKLSKDVASKVSTPKLHTKPIVRLEENELVDMINIAENGNRLSEREYTYHLKTKLRDVAIITLFLGTGIRISELIGLNVDSIDFTKNAFKITRKGGDEAILYFNDEVMLALLEYIEYSRPEFLSDNSNEKALFLSIQKKRMSTRAIEMLVKKFAAVVTPLKKITPHKLRSTFGTNLYRETQDIYVVAEMLGHKDINVTKKHYADISEDIKRKASLRVKLRDNNEINEDEDNK